MSRNMFRAFKTLNPEPSILNRKTESGNPKPILLVAEWAHFTLFGILYSPVELKVYTFLGLMNSATKC